mmetsp:Transcript_11636/g.20609  ORF Transcript_11636/g.20609 Transcript_11636/m.20609 type:complete len:93 (-) Transcript_11636:64-342(-)
MNIVPHATTQHLGTCQAEEREAARYELQEKPHEEAIVVAADTVICEHAVVIHARNEKHAGAAIMAAWWLGRYATSRRKTLTSTSITSRRCRL